MAERQGQFATSLCWPGSESSFELGPEWRAPFLAQPIKSRSGLAQLIWLLGWGLAALACGLLGACRGPAPAAHTLAPPVWSVTRGETTVYLFGSAHMLSPDTAWRSAEFEAAFADAERLVFEVGLNADTTSEVQALFERHGRNPPGMALSTLLAPEEAAQMSAVAQRFGLPMDRLETMRPWLAAQQIALAVTTANGASADHGVETLLQAQAGRRAVDALETPAEQIETLAGLRPEDERAMLALAVRDAAEDPEGSLRAEAAWAAGDLATIEALSLEAREAISPAFHDRLITARNARFAEAAAGYLLGPDDVLFVVGAAHLVGEAGVIALLRAQGLAVSGP
jgi:uncharacterized protein